ncbi:MAG: ABC transporter ATP-binding protein, partial [Clostridia bacterium]|nr:ABC transporter ATP-binding protein [Clostridia bacterium]
KLETDMRTDLFNHLQQLSFSYYNETKVGQIMARITSDLFDVTEFSHHCPEEFLIAGVKITASFIILGGMNVWLTLMVFLLLPFMLIGTRYFRQKMRIAFKDARHQVGEINAQVEDSLLGVRVVKSFANEDLEIEKFGHGNDKFYGLKKMQYRYMAGFNTVTRMFEGTMYILVVVAGALFLKDGKLAVGDYTAFLLYISTLLTSIRRIVDFSEQFERGMTGIERFCEIMDAPVEIKDKPGAKPIGDVKGEVRFEKVGFHYADDVNHEVLGSVDMLVHAGQNVALVGPSGAGKTTLCNLIPRFYDVTSGRILIDGKDIQSLTLKSLRNAIGMVQQEVYLFSGTVRENISYGKPGATEEEIVLAAKRAGAHEFVEKLPDGYDTYIGERGVKLSGGQKQRLAIARVFLKNPPILILDEATSALDNENELLVQRSLEELAKGRTTFTIAHRLTTIRNADVIWVLTEKGIEETGTHDELMQKKGIYHSLYSMYSGKAAS